MARTSRISLNKVSRVIMILSLDNNLFRTRFQWPSPKGRCIISNRLKYSNQKKNSYAKFDKHQIIFLRMSWKFLQEKRFNKNYIKWLLGLFCPQAAPLEILLFTSLLVEMHLFKWPSWFKTLLIYYKVGKDWRSSSQESNPWPHELFFSKSVLDCCATIAAL